MVSATVNVARYTALFAGVVYGFYHRRTLQAEHDQQKLNHAVHRQQSLIAEAKDAWKRKNEASKDNVISDPDDPRFDLEKFLGQLDKASS
ncbi:ATP synthase E chain-domain-containing protein [Collybia nuda]|uniref:ATP synthase F(0) complex subunit e, mitochondrial n=1 Tax=Collybia nuda TaxID=64659 RepID=A0A9P6CR30_9AGAR|nr:ATP synthase E chain-domain-containing protein [Collybia nuda]